MAVSFQLEPELERQLQSEMGDLATAAREALLIEAYRSGKISIGRLAHSLGVSVLEADAWLASRKVPLNYGEADYDADLRTIEQMDRQVP